MAFVLIVVMSGGTYFQEFPNIESCVFAGKNVLALSHEISERSTYRCVPFDKTEWFSK